MKMMKLSAMLVMLILSAGMTYAGDLDLSVAASLREAVTELSGAFAGKHAGVRFQSNFGGSGALAKQIENGAPADIFFSANMEWMDYLKGKGLIDGRTVFPFAFNELVFVGGPLLKVSGLKDVVRLEKIAIGSPGSVPAGQYAMEAFKKAGIDTQLEGKLVMARDVRECLMYADRGEVDGAFVYKTDAEQFSKNVKVLFVVPQGFYSRVVYPVAITKRGGMKADAAPFLKFLQSPEAKTVLLKYGFLVK